MNLKKVTCSVCGSIFKTENQSPPLLPDQDVDVPAPRVTEAYSRSHCDVCRADSPWRVVTITCEHCAQVFDVQLGRLFNQPRRKGDVPER